MKGWQAGFVGLAVVAMTGCAINFAKRSPWDIQQLAELSDQLEQFKTLAKLKAEEADQLRKAKEELEKRLSSSEATIGYDERGLVARMMDKVLFDSGKATLRRSANSVLDRVAEAIAQVPSQPVGVEGHTDNVPIQKSGWADNNALSLARANAVIDYLVSRGIDRSRMTAVGHGENRPIASNKTAKGRQQNRRVEIVVLPQSSEASYKQEAEQAAQSGTTYTK